MLALSNATAILASLVGQDAACPTISSYARRGRRVDGTHAAALTLALSRRERGRVGFLSPRLRDSA
jgi:hypothetical protein